MAEGIRDALSEKAECLMFPFFGAGSLGSKGCVRLNGSQAEIDISFALR